MAGRKPTSSFGGHTPTVPKLNRPPKPPPLPRGPTGPVTINPTRRG
jgi:hypothetical protein